MIAPVGAAIGRPPVKIYSDVKQHASAVKIFTIIIGRADAKTICSVFNANCLYGNTGRAILAPTIIGAPIFLHP